jgi:K+ transporter
VLTTSESTSPARTRGAKQTVRVAVVVGALGVVFGDIGTSPIYTLQRSSTPTIRQRRSRACDAGPVRCRPVHRTAFFSLAGVVLAVTGAEALHADMGHCGRTAIASQALITGAFSLASQAVQLGFLPRLRVVHTSASAVGQVYMPWINGMLMVAILILVFAFRSPAALANADGLAVTGTIAITTLLYLYIAHRRWRAPLWLIIVGGGALLGIDLLFVAANLTKLVHGA